MLGNRSAAPIVERSQILSNFTYHVLFASITFRYIILLHSVTPDI